MQTLAGLPPPPGESTEAADAELRLVRALEYPVAARGGSQPTKTGCLLDVKPSEKQTRGVVTEAGFPGRTRGE